MGWARAIIHVDLDAFYASVEQRRRPELRGRPVIVGGGGEGHTTRAVVSAASYEARRFGVHSAMPLGRALRLCPEAVLLPVDFPAYRRASARIFALARALTPLVEPLSLDEAYLDVSATPGEPPEMAARLRDQILEATGLDASFGVATCKTVAKIASDLRKPRGFVVVRPGEEAEFLRPLALRTLPGLGPATADALAGLGLRTLGDLARHPPALLERRLGRAAAVSLTQRAQGIDSSPVTPPAAPKSISREETYDRDVAGVEQLRDRIRHLSADVGRRLRAAGLTARTVSLKLRLADFTTLTRQRPFDGGGDSDAEITAGALALLAVTHRPGHPVRLLGVGVHHLEDAAQLDLFSAPADDRERRLDATLDSLRRRFGPDALRRGADPPELGDRDWRGEDLREP
ncbi:MAG: DNA polymerase IV [Candidatus Dormibacteria bacterium]